MDGEVWHLVEGRRDDGAPAIFRIRELAPRFELQRIFVIEMPYPITEMSRLPNAAAYRRLAQFEEQWVTPACAATGYEQVGLKIEEGSFFLYMYGAADPNDVISRLAPFDAALGFYDDSDPAWAEYATLKDLLDQAKAMPAEPEPETPRRARSAVTVPPANKPAARTTKLKKPAAKKAKAAKKAAAKASATRAPAARTSASKKPASKKPAPTKKSGAQKSTAKKARR